MINFNIRWFFGKLLNWKYFLTLNILILHWSTADLQWRVSFRSVAKVRTLLVFTIYAYLLFFQIPFLHRLLQTAEQSSLPSSTRWLSVSNRNRVDIHYLVSFRCPEEWPGICICYEVITMMSLITLCLRTKLLPMRSSPAVAPGTSESYSESQLSSQCAAIITRKGASIRDSCLPTVMCKF